MPSSRHTEVWAGLPQVPRKPNPYDFAGLNPKCSSHGLESGAFIFSRLAWHTGTSTVLESQDSRHYPSRSLCNVSSPEKKFVCTSRFFMTPFEIYEEEPCLHSFCMVCALKLEPTGWDQGSPLAPSGAVAQACPGRTLTTAIMAEEHCARLWGAKTLGYTGPQRWGPRHTLGPFSKTILPSRQ